jgi:hypothetical protein
MRIHNVIGSSKISASPPKPYGSWLSYWEDKAEFKLKENTQYECPACGAATFRRDFDGCHVQNLSFMDKSWYIVPLCSSCNHRTDSFNVDNVPLVPVPSNL